MKFLLLALLFSSCAGVTAREEVLTPAMSLVYDAAIQPAVVEGIQSKLDSGELNEGAAATLVVSAEAVGAALRGGNLDALRALPWHTLRLFAEFAIDERVRRGDIGPGVGALLKQRLAKFHEAYVEVLR